jgi:hypothetical protein
MAARKLRTKHSDEIRAKIQASQIINRLEDHISGKAGMSATQIQAAKILLAKSVPDLSSVTHSGDADDPVKVKVEVNFRDA